VGLSGTMAGVRSSLWPLLAATIALAACETQSATLIREPAPAGDRRAVRIVPCQDRTGNAERDLAAEGTKALTDRVKTSGLFQISASASLILTCDIEQFAEGSALKRWFRPGSGTTRAQVAVIVWDTLGDKMLGSFRSHSQVPAGGLYTIGADQYILGTAFDDVIKQLREWTQGPGGRKS
jgi:uncharacterized lipoprotein YajG